MHNRCTFRRASIKLWSLECGQYYMYVEWGVEWLDSMDIYMLHNTHTHTSKMLSMYLLLYALSSIEIHVVLCSMHHAHYSDVSVLYNLDMTC